MSTTKGTEEINERGGTEIKVETTDNSSPAGEDEKPTNEKIGVVHLTRNKGNSHARGGVLVGAADAVSRTVQSAKNAIWGSKEK